jgi:hypothetical protein
MNVFTKSYHWIIQKGGMFAFLLLIFVLLTALFNVLGIIVQGPVGLTPTIVSLFTTLLIWIGLTQTN